MLKSFIYCALTLLLCTSSTRLRALETAPMTKTNVVTVDSKEFEVALQAAAKGDLAPMKTLIAHGLDVNKVGKEAPPLFYAAVASPALVNLFLDAGADVNFQTPDEMTALKMSVIGNNVEIVQLLIRRGARVNDADKSDGMTVLISNVLMGSVEMARVLLKNGADVNMADHDGNTALMTASSLRKVEMVRLFLHAGADVLHKDKRGETALSNARSFLQVGDLLARSAKETASERASRLEGRALLTMLEAAEKRAKSRQKSLGSKGTR